MTRKINNSYVPKAAMTAQVEFFCSPTEECDVLRYLTKNEGTLVYDVADGRLTPWDAFSVNDIPDRPSPLSLYIHQPAHGTLIWYTSRPAVAGPTHRSFVKNLYAREEWDERGLDGSDKLLDSDLSPIISYRRGTPCDGKTGQKLVLAPPSNLQRVGPEYERWVTRSLAWIRRHSTIVHDYHKQSETIPNPHSIVSTIYAFPDVLADIKSKHHSFAILIQDGT
jgi:hypothetical protein